MTINFSVDVEVISAITNLWCIIEWIIFTLYLKRSQSIDELTKLIESFKSGRTIAMLKLRVYELAIFFTVYVEIY